MSSFQRIPKQARSLEKFEKILESADYYFRHYPLDEVTTNKIADRAEVSVGTIYSYFKDKNDLLLLVYEKRNEILTASVLDEFQGDLSKDYESFLEHAIRKMIFRFRDDQHLLYSIEMMVSKETRFKEIRKKFDQIGIDTISLIASKQQPQWSPKRVRIVSYLIHRMVYESLKNNLAYGHEFKDDELISEMLRMVRLTLASD